MAQRLIKVEKTTKAKELIPVQTPITSDQASSTKTPKAARELSIKTQEVTYNSVELGTDVTHCILIAHQKGKDVLLSHPNLFLYKHTRSSIASSTRHATLISMFYRFLATQPKMKGIDLGYYHAMADNTDIRRWQVHRQLERLEKNSPKPSSETIFEDAKVLLIFFKWLNDHGYVTNVDVQTRTWRANFRSGRMLSYIDKVAKSTISSRNIRVLDKQSRQKQYDFLITNNEIKALLQSYADPVYAVLFQLGLGTAMRPMDLVRFPYVGNAANKHIMPFSEMAKHGVTTQYTVYDSKGHKDREITIHMDDLRSLEENYIIPYYKIRRQLYKKRFKHDCPPDVLFLTNRGIPVDPDRIASRTNDAKVKAATIEPTFRSHINFYQSRHWWPTQYLINMFGKRLLTENMEVLYLAAAQVLTQQMGHEDVATTYKFYVDMARVLMFVHEGKALDLIRAPEHSVSSFIERLRPVDRDELVELHEEDGGVAA